MSPLHPCLLLPCKVNYVTCSQFREVVLLGSYIGTDPRLTDYDTLLKNIHDLKAGKHVEVPIYDFKASMRTGYRFGILMLLKI